MEPVGFGKTILIVEDDRDIRGCLEMVLRSAGYIVESAGNGRQALDLLGNHIPSLILLDLMMPVMDGWQFRAAQVQDLKLATIPVVVMTAGGQAAHYAKLMNTSGFVQKPLDLDHLIETLSKLAA